MAREKALALEKVTINLFLGDRETLQDFHSADGWSVAVRDLVHKKCKAYRERDSQEVQRKLKIKIPIGDLKL